VFCAAFLFLQFVFLGIFWQKEIDEKAALQKEMKLIIGVNITNFLVFLYKSVFQSFSVLTVWICNFLAK